MCVSAARSLEARVKISFNNQTVEGKDSLKILGVTLDKNCTFTSHVTEVAKKLKQKTLALSRLKRKGMLCKNLVQVYKSTIWPSAEYVSPEWH